jgi:uncharacterized protein (TIGR02145 family)
MKRIIFLSAAFFAITVNAQNYLISFAGAGGSVIGTVKVENMNTGISTTLNGTDILHLSGTTAINDSEISGKKPLVIYPNPVTENATILVSPPKAGDATLSITDLTGKVLTRYQGHLGMDQSEFLLSGLKSGYYVVSLRGADYQCSGKILSNGTKEGELSIDLIREIQTTSVKEGKTGNKGIQATVDMAYSAGQRLKFTAISGNNSTVITNIPLSDKTISFIFFACTDADNYNYPVVEIGTQVWMAENLKTGKYRNGDLIGTTNPSTLDVSGESSPKYQWAYSGNESNVALYGRLYTWYAVTDVRNVCPAGWHVPAAEEFTTLTNFLGSAAGSKLKEAGTVHWRSPNTGTNESGFTALPGGRRDTGGGFLDLFHGLANWWSTNESGPSYPDYGSACLRVDYDLSYVLREVYHKTLGCSVRCVKD